MNIYYTRKAPEHMNTLPCVRHSTLYKLPCITTVCAICKLPCTIPNAVHYTGYRALHKLPHIKQGTVHGTNNSFPDKLSYMWLDALIYTSYHALQQVLCTIQERILIASYCAIYKRLQFTIYSCKLQYVHITIYNKIVAIYNNVLQGTRVGACKLQDSIAIY